MGELVNVSCEWENCRTVLSLLPSEFETFSEHLKGHADEFISSLKNEAASQDEDIPISCCCMWRQCSWEGCEDLMGLIRHIMFHGYHTLLKSLGHNVQMNLSIAACKIEVDDPHHMLSFVTAPYVCYWNNCNTEFICPDKYYRHVQLHISQTSVEAGCKTVRLKCQWINNHQTCEQDFRDKHKLKEHVRVHTHEKLLACPGCGALFSNRTKFLDHLSRQNQKAYVNFQCSHCLKRYASERLLRDHMRHHINYLKCPHCDMTCPNPGSLKSHVRYRHNDVRPFHCCVCNLKFKSSSDLNRHEETHLSKMYLCNSQGCKFSTKTSRSLQSHFQLKHSAKTLAKPYMCHICNHAYSRGYILTKHLKKKHNYCWPSGHPRFRYIEHEDGLYRLQMVRFQSVELTQKLQQEGTSETLDCEVDINNGTIDQTIPYGIDENDPNLILKDT